MRMKIVYTHTARQDLREIYEYIAYTLLVPETARSLTDKIMSEVRSLEEFPERNPLYKDEPWRSQGVRFLPVKNYLVFYTVKWRPRQSPSPVLCMGEETSAASSKKQSNGNNRGL